MFGIGSGEILVILIVALLVLGPDKLPSMAKTLGKGMGELRRLSMDFHRALNSEVEPESPYRAGESEKYAETAVYPKAPPTPSEAAPAPGVKAEERDWI